MASLARRVQVYMFVGWLFRKGYLKLSQETLDSLYPETPLTCAGPVIYKADLEASDVGASKRILVQSRADAGGASDVVG